MNIKTKQHYFVGLDVHLRLTAVCILDANCKIVREQIVKGHSPEVCKFLRENINGSYDVVFEACDGYGFWYEKLNCIARRVVVAHPNHLRIIWNTKKKTDRIDAQKLAKLLGLNLIPPVYVPKVDVRDWRMLIQHRQTLVQKRTRIKNKLRAILRRNHIPAPRNLWSKKNCRWLRGVEFYAKGETLQRDLLMEDLEHCNNQIGRVVVELDHRAKNN